MDFDAVSLLEMSLKSSLDERREVWTLVADEHPQMFCLDVAIELRLGLEFFFAHEAVGVNDVTVLVVDGHLDDELK